jgi:TonB family protein
MEMEQTMEQRGQAVNRLRSLFDMHHIAFGAPEDLDSLLASVHQNRHFAMDFWSQVNALSENGSGSLSDAAMLDAMVEASTGVLPEVLPEPQRPAARELGQMLAGVDVARPSSELPPPIAKPADALLPPRRTEGKFAAALEALSDDEVFKKRRSIGDALARLEQSTRELRDQLAHLDEQMAGSHGVHRPPGASEPQEPLPSVEPLQVETMDRRNGATASPGEDVARATEAVERHDNKVTSPVAEAHLPQPAPVAAPAVVTPLPVAPVPSPVPAAVVVPVVVPIAEPVRKPAVAAQPPVEVFEPRPAHTLSQRGLAFTEPDDDPSIPTPLASYATESERSPVVGYAIVAVIVAVLGAGGYAGARTETGHAWLQRATESIRGAYNSATGKPSETPAAPAATEPAQSAAAPVDAPVPPANPQSNTAGATTPGSEPLPSAVLPAPAPATPSPASSSAPRSADRADSTNRNKVSQKIIDSSLLRVPASTMAANLVTSRVPAYPDAARAQEIEGSVLMDVVVSEAGMVKYVRVIDGDRHLRAAAEDAVMRWRYKPYLLNGSPVEVTTTVKVDFRLPR